MLWLCFTIAWSEDKLFALRDGANMIYPIIVYMFARASTDSAQSSDRLLRLLKLTLTVLGAVSLFFSVVYYFVSSSRGWWQPGASRLVDVPFGIHPLVGTLFVALELAGYKRVPRWKVRWWLVLATTGTVYLTLTRAYVVGFILALAAVFFARTRQRWAKPVMALLGVAAIVALLSIDNPIKRRMFWQPKKITPVTLCRHLATGTLFNEDVIVYSGRIEYWKYLLGRARARSPAWMGAGVGAARSYMLGSPFAAYPHGDIARVLCDSGHLGLALFIVTIVTAGLYSLAWAGNEQLSPIGRTAAIGLVAQVVMTVVSGSVYDIFHSPYQNLIIAMILMAVLRSEIGVLRRGDPDTNEEFEMIE